MWHYMPILSLTRLESDGEVRDTTTPKTSATSGATTNDAVKRKLSFTPEKSRMWLQGRACSFDPVAAVTQPLADKVLLDLPGPPLALLTTPSTVALPQDAQKSSFLVPSVPALVAASQGWHSRRAILAPAMPASVAASRGWLSRQTVKIIPQPPTQLVAPGAQSKSREWLVRRAVPSGPVILAATAPAPILIPGPPPPVAAGAVSGAPSLTLPLPPDAGLQAFLRSSLDAVWKLACFAFVGCSSFV